MLHFEVTVLVSFSVVCWLDYWFSLMDLSTCMPDSNVHFTVKENIIEIRLMQSFYKCIQAKQKAGDVSR